MADSGDRASAARGGRLPLAVLLALGGLLGLAVFFLTFPFERVLGPADGFAGLPDQQQHLAALRFFAWDSWRWPLFLAGPLGEPEGTVIVFMDGLPLYGLLVRALRGWVFDLDSNLLALWLGFCYALQGAAPVAALRLAGLRRPGLLLAAALLALALPAFVLRFEHAPLCAQGFVILALGLYFRSANLRRCRQVLPWAIGLCWLLTWINGYLLVMAGAVTGALLLQGLAARQIGWARAAGSLAALLAGCALLMWAGGYFADYGPAAGFGTFSMNLLSPLLPQDSLLFPGRPRLDATGGQGEGFNYLGAGLLLLLLALPALGWGGWRARLARHWPLALALLGLTLLALSNRVFAGQTLLLDLEPVPALLGQIRSSGRLFWTVAYALLLGALLLLGRRRGWLVPALALAAVALQAADTQGYRDLARSTVAAPKPFALPAEPWRPVLAAHQRVRILPPFECAAQNEDRALINLLVFHASAVQVATSTAYTARPKPVDCAEAVGLLFFGAPPPGELWVAVGAQTRLPALALSGIGVQDAPRRCRHFAGGVACSAAEWPASDYFLPARVNAEKMLPAFPLGATLVPALAGPPAPYLGPGWRAAAAEGAWTGAGRAYLLLRPQPLPAESFRLVLEATLPAGGGEQSLAIQVNGQEVDRWTAAADGAGFRREVELPRSLLTGDGLLLVALESRPLGRDSLPGELGLLVRRVTLQGR